VHWPDDQKPHTPPKQQKKKEKRQEPQRRPADLVHEYTDLKGTLVLQVLRWYTPGEGPEDPPDKRISQRAPDPNQTGEWITSGISKLLPPNLLYRWPDTQAALEANDPVYITEGETDADAVIDLGNCATTNPMGAGNFKQPHAKWIASIASDSPLIICMDRDDDGRKRVGVIKDLLLAMGVASARVKVVRPLVGKDVKDHLAAGQTLEALFEVPPEEIEEDESTVGRLRRIALRSTIESMLTNEGFAPASSREYIIKNFLPAGIVGLVVAEGGTGKGHLMVHMGMSLAMAQPFGPFDVEQQCGWIYVTYEDDYDEVHRRIINHRMSALDKMSLDEWERKALLRNVRVVDYSGEMDAVLSRDLVEVLANTRDTIETGRCVITIDPLTKILPSDVQLNTAEGAGLIMRYLWSLSAEAQSSVLAVHHIRKPTMQHADDVRVVTMHDTMGSAQLVNLSRWVLNVSSVEAQELGFVGHREAVRCEVTKSNYTAAIPPVAFVRERGGALVWREIPEDTLTDAEAAIMHHLMKKGILLSIDLEKHARKGHENGGLGLAKNVFEKARKTLAKRGLIEQSRTAEQRVQWAVSPKGSELTVFSMGHANSSEPETEEEEEEGDIF
jgi:hypothetical protein